MSNTLTAVLKYDDFHLIPRGLIRINKSGSARRVGSYFPTTGGWILSEAVVVRYARYNVSM